jgi:hypothetical protein
MKVVDKVAQATVDAMLRQAATGNFGSFDAATAGGMAFLQGELEKRDPKVREPLTSVTWMRDIVCKTGGGFVDFTSAFNVNYGTSGANMLGLMGGETTNIPLMQADLSKDLWPVFGWSNILKVPFVDQQKMQQIGRSLDDLLDKGIRLNWSKANDLIVYQGFGGSPGIVNNSSITAIAVANGAAGTKTWATKTPDEILADVNQVLVNTWAASEYDLTGMANHILIPPAQFADICNRKVSSAGNCSILTYLLENNIAVKQGVDLQIYPSRWCKAAGANGTDRMVGYVNDEDKLYFDQTVPIQRAMTAPDVKEAAYLTLYVGQIGVPKFLYLQPAGYFDGI